jgi:hypothetical protein
LQTKFDLVEGDSIPDSFAKFATSAVLFNMGTKAGQDNNNPPEIANLKESGFPQDFLNHIVETTRLLKQRLSQLYEARMLRDEKSKNGPQTNPTQN